jgi:hypothetical protein
MAKSEQKAEVRSKTRNDEAFFEELAVLWLVRKAPGMRDAVAAYLKDENRTDRLVEARGIRGGSAAVFILKLLARLGAISLPDPRKEDEKTHEKIEERWGTRGRDLRLLWYYAAVHSLLKSAHKAIPRTVLDAAGLLGLCPGLEDWPGSADALARYRREHMQKLRGRVTLRAMAAVVVTGIGEPGEAEKRVHAAENLSSKSGQNRRRATKAKTADPSLAKTQRDRIAPEEKTNGKVMGISGTQQVHGLERRRRDSSQAPVVGGRPKVPEARASMPVRPPGRPAVGRLAEEKVDKRPRPRSGRVKKEPP